MASRIGWGEFASPKAVVVFSQARFLDVVRIRKPAVLEQLYKLIQHHGAAFQRYDPAGFTYAPEHQVALAEIGAWCKLHNLVLDGEPAPWCILAAYKTGWHWIDPKIPVFQS